MTKIRCGFVTNSSSSSFIVALKDIPKNFKEMQIVLFGNDDKDAVVEVYDNRMSCRDIAFRVLSDIQSQTPNDEGAIDNALAGYFADDNAPNYHEYTRSLPFNSKEYDKAAAQYERDHAKFVKAKIKRFRKQFRDFDYYVFSYADNGGEVVLEHGDIFRNLPHLKISHH